MSYKNLQIVKGKEKAIYRKHPWVFSGAIKNIPADLQAGEIVELNDYKGQFLATGFYNKGSIAVKILSFEKLDEKNEWLRDKINNAINYRKSAGIFNLPETNCCRLIFAEGDGLPGLIVDKYDTTAVVQLHDAGWIFYLDILAKCLVETGIIEQVYHKENKKLNSPDLKSGWILGSSGMNEVLEYGHRFIIDWEGGQKTGFFIDQRENRKRVGQLAKGKRVLNTFSYTGGFSVYALAEDAEFVCSVDISKPAVDLAVLNAKNNGFQERHKGIAEDVFSYLEREGSGYDIIILDPPAFSKSRKTMHNAVQGYKRLNSLAIRYIKPGGIIFTFSCSQHISPQLFEDTIRAAAIETGRNVRIMERLNQPADHPINAFHPEGEYLKGLVLIVQ